MTEPERVSDEEAQRFLAEHADYDEDIDFWRRAAAALGGPVLDLGCAAGRVALPLARDGHTVWALDASDAMLAALDVACQTTPIVGTGRVKTVRADLTTFTLDQTFPLVFCSMNTLQVLIDPHDQRTFLERVRHHLHPGGEFIFDVILPDLGEIASRLGQLLQVGATIDESSGRSLMRWACYEDFDPISQTADILTIVDEFEPGEPLRRRTRRHRVHLFLPSELLHLLALSGLEVIEILGDFDGAPVEAVSQRQIYRCRRAELP